MTDSASYHRLI